MGPNTDRRFGPSEASDGSSESSKTDNPDTDRGIAGDQMKKGNLNARNPSLQFGRENEQTGGLEPERTWECLVDMDMVQNRKSGTTGLGANAANLGHRASGEAGGLSEAVEHVAQ
jgi:hypothetical protein